MEHTVKKDFKSEFEEFQSQLFPYAYNIIGDVMESEDIVNEILNAYFMESSHAIQTPRNYLTRSVINRAINAKKRLHLRREQYPGQWLPVPINTEEGVYREADKKGILNYSLMVLLELLNPKERAVFILKESFDYSHGEIAEILHINVDNVRQLYKRGKEKLDLHARRIPRQKREAKSILEDLAEAILQADVERVKGLLSDDVESLSDGGPKTSAARNIVSGKDHVYKLLKAIYGKCFLPGTDTEVGSYNHLPAMLFKMNGHVYTIMVFEIIDRKIERLFIIINPDKTSQL